MTSNTTEVRWVDIEHVEEWRKGKVYLGCRTTHKDVFLVHVNDTVYPLQLPSEKIRFSTNRFAWGINNPASRALALSILVDYLDDVPRAVDLHYAFTVSVIAKVKTPAFVLSSEEIQSFLQVIESQEREQPSMFEPQKESE
jgi:hypothetical protein